MRNPNKYVGKKIKLKCQINQISEDGLFTQGFLRCYSYSGYDIYADYYSFTDYGNEEDYYGMVEKILSHSKFQSEAAKKMKREMDESSAEAFFRKYKFVTLSTCRTMDGKDKRLMVIGCRKR